MNDLLIKHDIVESLYDTLSTAPPDYTEARATLGSVRLSSKELSGIACKIADDCFDETSYRCCHNDESYELSLECDKRDANGFLIPEKLLSYHLFNILDLLLENGMNPNDVVGEKHYENNIIRELFCFVYKFIYCAFKLLRREFVDSVHDLRVVYPGRENNDSVVCFIGSYAKL